MKKTLTIIPAKLGSNRLPGKNIRDLAGKPMINYTIEAALDSGVCGEVMVSTESDEVAKIAVSVGAIVPFIRPDYLGKDPYGVADVCLHVLNEYEHRGRLFEKLIILLPTSPLRSILDIRESDRIFEAYHADFLMSVSEFAYSPFSVLQTQKMHEPIMVPCFPESVSKKRHERPSTYMANGAICITDVKAFQKAGTYYGSPLYTYVMPPYRSVDIDTAIDFDFANFLIRQEYLNECR